MKAEDQVIEQFDMRLIRAVIPAGAPLIVVYHNPVDYPGLYVARLFDGKRGTHLIVLAESMEEIQMAKPGIMKVFDRAEADPPQIVETWI